MKHKILISIDPRADGPQFLREVKTLLNSSHSKIITGVPIANYLEKKLVLADEEHTRNRPKLNQVDPKLEVNIIREANRLNMQFKLVKEDIDNAALATLSSVADLLVIDRRILQNYCGEDILAELVDSVLCPVLILPDKKAIDGLLVVHDGTQSSVQAVKYFISLFNQSLRSLPVSVLVSDPKTKQDIMSEKVFIDYIKLFFKDIGIQLMHENPIDCIIQNITQAAESPMLIMGEVGGDEVLNCNTENRMITDNAPTFIFKRAKS